MYRKRPLYQLSHNHFPITKFVLQRSQCVVCLPLLRLPKELHAFTRLPIHAMTTTRLTKAADIRFRKTDVNCFPPESIMYEFIFCYCCSKCYWCICCCYSYCGSCFLKGPSQPFFFILVSSTQTRWYVHYKILPMIGFEHGPTSCLGSDRSDNWATTTALMLLLLIFLLLLLMSLGLILSFWVYL